MLKIIRETDDPALMEQVWGFRHRRFVEQLGWEELRRVDERERDEFDTDEALHAVLVHRGNVVGYSRLLPTVRPHLTNDFCCRGGFVSPSGPLIFEWSRCAAALNVPAIDGCAVSDLLMTGLLECLVEIGASTIVFLTYPPVVKMMRRRGYPIQLIGSLPLANGDQVEAVSSVIPAGLLTRHRIRHGIHGSLLEWGQSAIAAQRRPLTAA